MVETQGLNGIKSSKSIPPVEAAATSVRSMSAKIPPNTEAAFTKTLPVNEVYASLLSELASVPFVNSSRRSYPKAAAGRLPEADTEVGQTRMHFG